MVAKSLLILVPLIACSSVPRADRASAAANFWESLAGLNADKAIASARTPDERRFATAVRNLMVGEMQRAEEGFNILRREAPDSIIRSGARVMYVAALQYQEKWRELAALNQDGAMKGTTSRDKASIERWSGAFSAIPPKTFEFSSGTSTIPMTVSSVGTPLIRVQIASRQFDFWLDTGSSMTMLSSDVATSLSISPLVGDTLEIVTSTGRIAAQPGVIPELRIGQLSLRNVPAMIVDEKLMRMRESRSPALARQLKIDGIIGFDIIRLLDIEVDYASRRLTLRNPAHSRQTRDRNIYWVGLPVVRLASVGGLPLHFALDTGAQLTFVTETLLEKLRIQAARIENRRVGGLGSEISMRASVLPDLRVRLRGHPLVFRGAVVRPPVYQLLAALDGVLGADVWTAGAIRIDVTNGVFSVTTSGRN